MTAEEEKAEFGAGTFQLFCDQFGKDVYSHILLEVLLEGIINAETLFVFGEEDVNDGSNDVQVERKQEDQT